MNDKVVFFDIDGTLLNEQKQLPESAKEAVQQLRKNGIHTVIATGRAPFMFAPLREELEIDSFVSFNGQYVSFHGDVIYKNALDIELMKQLEEKAIANAHPMVFLDHEGMRANKSFHPYIEESMGSLKFHHPDFDPHYYNEREIYQALLFCDDKVEEEYRSSYEQLRFIRWHERSLDILPEGGSKARGIQAMIEKLNIPKEHVYAFGDGLNDIEMLSAVGTGIAMGNAKDEAKQVADFVTSSVDEDGIWHGLKKAGLL